MPLNDKVLTLATGLFLAVGGGAASLWFGDHHGEKDIVVATLGAPNLIAPSPEHTDVTLGPVIASMQEPVRVKDPAMPGVDRQSTEDTGLVFASVEPRANRPVGADLAEIAVAAIAPEIADIAAITDIVLTRSFELPDPPASNRSAAIQPVFGSGMKLVTLPAVPVADCALDVRATRLPGARVRLSIDAPCHPGVTATVEHAGLRFKEQLDNHGRLSLKIPVFEEYSRFDIRLSDGTQTTVGAYIADLSAVERVGISFAGADDTFLHATEVGADWDSDGHVWRLSPRSHARARATGGGYMTVLGNPDLPGARLVQVFTLPRRSNAGALVDFSIESLRSDCGQSLDLRLARVGQDGATSQRQIDTKAMACGEDGSLVLKNAVKAITLAQR